MKHLRIDIVAVIAVAALLSACSSMPSFERSTKPGEITDDDAVCRAKGYAAGSPEYVACRKDRDVANSRENRMERAHRNLAEDMVNGQSKGDRPWR